jgi:peptidyl-tRNA hydrolase, PTH1 family
MKLFVGLGNPGPEYAGNRHNVGFMAIDLIADRHGFSGWKKKFSGHIADGKLAGERVLLLKPQTYMNESGRSVQAAARFYKIDPEDVFVFYDEIDLAPSKLKVKQGGGNAGHNGLRSITAQVANDYHRIRIGVGHPGERDQVANYVLSNFAKSDRAWLDPMLEAIADAAGLLAKQQPDRFLSTVARDLRPDHSKGREQPPSNRKKAGGKAAASEAKAVNPTENSTTSSKSGESPSPSGRGTAESKATSASEGSGSSLADSLKNWLNRRQTASDRDPE